MYYSTILESLIRDLDREVRKLEEELRSMPQGRLEKNTSKGRPYYQQYLPPHGFRKSPKRINLTRNPEMIHLLARKRFLQEQGALAQRNLAILKEARDAYKVWDPSQYGSALGGPYKDLPAEMFMPLRTDPTLEESQRLQTSRRPGTTTPFADRMLLSDTFRAEDLIHKSSSGVLIRTKSELVILGRLEYFCVDATYEERIFIGGEIARPDFTIQRRRDGKTIYWEHAGLMTDPGYRARHDKKMHVYEQNGIVPWDNLILTYDDEKGGLDVRLVDALIQGWLL